MNSESLDYLAELEREHLDLPSNESIVPHGQRRCPICNTAMKTETEYGVHMDVCEQHGLWLDRGELGAVVSRIRSSERLKRKDVVEKAKREGKMSAMTLGVLSLMFD